MAEYKQGHYKQGWFRPKFPKKYIGDPTNIAYRSGWEKSVMEFCDTNSGVISWGSEEVIIPYISPIDNRPHRYFVDFYIETLDKNGNKQVTLVEVKPHKQTREPKKPKRRTKKYLTEVMDWGVNQAKWLAAESYCKDRGWKFRIWTEEQLFKE